MEIDPREKKMEGELEWSLGHLKYSIPGENWRLAVESTLRVDGHELRVRVYYCLGVPITASATWGCAAGTSREFWDKDGNSIRVRNNEPIEYCGGPDLGLARGHVLAAMRDLRTALTSIVPPAVAQAGFMAYRIRELGDHWQQSADVFDQLAERARGKAGLAEAMLASADLSESWIENARALCESIWESRPHDTGLVLTARGL